MTTVSTRTADEVRKAEEVVVRVVSESSVELAPPQLLELVTAEVNDEAVASLAIWQLVHRGRLDLHPARLRNATTM